METTKRKLSELIREGAKLRPMGKGFYFNNGCSCALGAAFEALTGVGGDEAYDIVDAKKSSIDVELSRVLFGGWRGEPTVKSVISGEQVSITVAVPDMNDSGKYTREQIADWLQEQGY